MVQIEMKHSKNRRFVVDRSVQAPVVDADGVNRFWCQNHVDEEQRHYRDYREAEQSRAGRKRKGGPGSTDGAVDAEDGSHKKKQGRKKTKLRNPWDEFRSQCTLGRKETPPSHKTMSAWYWGLSEQEWDKLVADTELYNSKVKAGQLPSPSDRASRLGRAERRQQGPSAPGALALAHLCPESTADFAVLPFQQAGSCAERCAC